MDTVTVSVKYSNRAFSRLFVVVGDDFNDFYAIKDQIKGLGGKYADRKWAVSADAMKVLKSKFQVLSFDFDVSSLSNPRNVEFFATGEIVSNEGDVKKMQEKYNDGDEALLRYVLEKNPRDFEKQVFVKMLKFHEAQPWAQEIISSYKKVC